jgi:hypothetical protein
MLASTTVRPKYAQRCFSFHWQWDGSPGLCGSGGERSRN